MISRRAFLMTPLAAGAVVGDGSAAYGVPAGSKGIKRVLLTHARRDAFGDVSVPVVVPAAERELFEAPEKFWAAFETARFHDYAQRSTKVPVRALRVERAVSDGDTVGDAQVISTPGYSSGAVTYLAGRKAYTGDLIYGDGQIFDLYSLQDAVPEAKTRGYHGYAARAGDLIASLRKVAERKPDVIVPARGPEIRNPQRAIGRAITHLQTFLASHFETDALRWYWGDENHRIRSRAVDQTLNILPMAEEAKLPDDIVAMGNSRLIRSKSGGAFLVDGGYSKILAELGTARVEGVWITHYHDDHTDRINDIVAKYGCPVYFTERMKEVLARPGAFRLPCLTKDPIPVTGAKRDGETLRWHEWLFTFWFFPGQTLYHGGLVARNDDGRSYLFVGDSFTPSGMDDYCMQNRCFLRAGEGYDYCLTRIASLPKNTWLMNQHVAPMFRYTDSQMARMRSELGRRSATLSELSPWPDINYMIDESWARVYPHGSEAAAGSAVDLEVRILNHAPSRMTYEVAWNLPPGWKMERAEKSVSLDARADGAVRARMRAGAAGLHVVTADVSFGGRRLREWTEALVRVR